MMEDLSSVSLDQVVELQQADYCSSIDVDFSIRIKINPMFTTIKILIVALLNTIGGLIRLNKKNGTECDATLLDRFQRDMMDPLEVFIPKAKCCIETTADESSLRILVNKSKHFTTLASHMISRCAGRNYRLTGDGDIACVIQEDINEPIEIPLFHDSAKFKYDDILPICEGDNIEFKSWDIARKMEHNRLQNKKPDSAIGIYMELIQKQCAEALFSLPNKKGSGRLILGVREIKGRGNVIIGQELSKADEEAFKEFLQDFLTKDPESGDARIWGEEGVRPVYGVHWEMQTYPVFKDLDKNMSHPTTQPRLVLMVVHLKQVKGGLFMRCPESYTVTPDGRIKNLSFSEWKLKVLSSVRRQPIPVSDPVMKSNISQTAQVKDETITHHGNVMAQNDESYSDGKTYDKVELDYLLENESMLSWVDINRNWKHNITFQSRALAVNVADMTRESKVLTATNPVHFTPEEELITKHCSDMENVLVLIKEITKEGFGISASKLTRWFENDTQVPELETHVLDIIVVETSGQLRLFVIVKNTGDKEQQELQIAYLYLTARAVKLHLVESLYSEHILTQPTNIAIHCHLYALDEQKLIIDSHAPDFFSKNALPFNVMQRIFAKLLLSKPTRVKLALEEEVTYQMSKEQCKVVLGSDLAQVNLICGPPGSGKTLLAFFLCNLFGKTETIFVTKNPALQNFVDYQNICSTTLLEDEIGFGAMMRSGQLEGKKCVILDDVQTMNANAYHWNDLLSNIMNKEQILCLFGDNKFQNYADVDQMKILKTAVSTYCIEHDMTLYIRDLNHVHRNSQRMTAYLKECAHLDNPLTCTSPSVGDDVETLVMPNIREHDDNPLVKYIQSITSNPIAYHSNAYTFNQIAVMVATSNPETDIELFFNILAKFFPIQKICNMDYKKPSIRIGLVEHFHGLDATVCICITALNCAQQANWTNTDKEGHEYEIKQVEHEAPAVEVDDIHHNLQNNKYKSFIASRAVAKLVYITEKALNTEIASTLEFSNIESYHCQRSNDVDPLKEVEHSAQDLLSLIQESEVSREESHNEYLLRNLTTKLGELIKQSKTASDEDNLSTLEVLGRHYTKVLFHLIDKENTRFPVYSHIVNMAWTLLRYLMGNTDNHHQFVVEGGLQYAFESIKVYGSGHTDIINQYLLILCYLAFTHYALFTSERINILLQLLNGSSDRTKFLTVRIFVRLLMYNRSLDETLKVKITETMQEAINTIGVNFDSGVAVSHVHGLFIEWLNSDLPVIRYYTAWSMAHLVHRNPDKYCPILARDVGLGHLESVIHNEQYGRDSMVRDFIELTVRAIKQYNEKKGIVMNK